MNPTKKISKTSCILISISIYGFNLFFSAVLEEHRKQCEMEGKYVGKYLEITNDYSFNFDCLDLNYRG